MKMIARQPFKARNNEEVLGLLGAAATAILAVVIISMLYFGRDILVAVALAILLSFVLAPLVNLLQRIRVPRGLSVVSVVILAFALIFAMGSLLAAPTFPTRRGPPELSVDDQSKDSIVPGREGRQQDAGARVRHAEGSQQGTG